MLKKLLDDGLVVFFVVVMFAGLFHACGKHIDSNTEVNAATESIVVEVEHDTGVQYLHLYEDVETGVQYFLYKDTTGDAGGSAITPRYNADGTLYISDKVKDKSE